MSNRIRKQILSIISIGLCFQMVFGLPSQKEVTSRDRQREELPHSLADSSTRDGYTQDRQAPKLSGIKRNVANADSIVRDSIKENIRREMAQMDSIGRVSPVLQLDLDPLPLAPLPQIDPLPLTPLPHLDSLDFAPLTQLDSLVADSQLPPSSINSIPMDTIAMDSIARDSTGGKVRQSKPFLDDVISGHNKDSLIFNVRKNMVYIYREGDVTYQEMNLKADYMQINMESKNIYAYGYTDSLGLKSKPEFLDKGESYTMDTIHYNIDTKKAKIKGVARKEGDGFLIAKDIKKMKDNSFNVMSGKYTTCENVDHPHFYLAMTRAKVLPGEKIIVAPSYFVMEDVPLYFLGIPFGFFPVTTGRKSGFIVPSFGEEYVKGFYIREGGYYFAFNDYVDATLLGGIYTLGSWEASLQSRYIKKYKYSGGLNFRYTQTIIGEKEDTVNYSNSKDFRFTWTHTQDPKFKPDSKFSAQVEFATGGFKQHGSNNLNDFLKTQTSSSISYSKNWTGKPYSLSMGFTHSQTSSDTTVSLGLPKIVFNVSTIYPFKRKNATGKEKWYEKIRMGYTGNLDNSVTVKERDLFKDEMFNKMKSGVKHSIPVSATISLFSYINITPAVNYNEYWHFRKVDKRWDPVEEKQMAVDTTYGFYRLFDYNVNASITTKIYGMFQFKGDNPAIKAIRHMLTPTIGFSYRPDFGKVTYGYYKPIQTNKDGAIGYYSPYEGNMYGVPSRGEQMSMNFSLSNTLEMKIRSDKDTSGVRKIKLIDQLSLSANYNFLAKEFKLSTISANLRTTIYGNYGINVTATFDPYQVEVDENGRATRVNKFLIKKGKLVRLTNASTGFNYSLNSKGGGAGGQAAMNDMNSGGAPTPEQNDFFATNGINDPNQQRQMMSSQYYDFNIPWNFGFNYSLSYSNDGAKKNIVQTLGFNGSVTLTEKWGVNLAGGYDLDKKKFTSSSFTISRDLHCWQMNFTWVPLGYMKSWNFHISVKSNVLRDIKWEKSSSRNDSLFD